MYIFLQNIFFLSVIMITFGQSKPFKPIGTCIFYLQLWLDISFNVTQFINLKNIKIVGKKKKIYLANVIK